MGVSKQGLVAVLTNFREEGAIHPETRSRGSMVNAFLTQTKGQFDSTADFVKHLVDDGDGLKGVGGFSLVCGRVGEPLAVISNRTPSVKGTTWVLKNRGETIGLSNAAFADCSWTKVTRGKDLLQSAIEKDFECSEYDRLQRKQPGFVENLFGVLSIDTLPKRSAKVAGWESYVREFRNSIFIPAVGGEAVEGANAEDLAAAQTSQKTEGGKVGIDGMSGLYGTQKQSVVLVSNQGHVTFMERTLYDDDARPMNEDAKERRFEFDIEEWGVEKGTMSS